MLGGVIANGLNAALPYTKTETFEGKDGVVGVNSPGRSAIISILTAILVMILILFLGQFLWNNVLRALVPGVKEATSVWQILGLSILISLIHPGCQCYF